MARAKKRTDSLIKDDWQDGLTEGLVSAGLTQAGVVLGAIAAKQIETNVIKPKVKADGTTGVNLAGPILQAIGIAGEVFLGNAQAKAVTAGVGAYGAIKTVRDFAKQDLKDKVGLGRTLEISGAPDLSGLSHEEMVHLLGIDDMDYSPEINSPNEAAAMNGGLDPEQFI